MPLLARLEHSGGFCGHMNPGDPHTRTCKYQNETRIILFIFFYYVGFQFMPLAITNKFGVQQRLFFFVASGELEIRHAHG
jgi:hypothetical protein